MPNGMIHKQPLLTQDTDFIRVPYGSEILSVGMQGGRITVWYRFIEGQEERPIKEEELHFQIVGTGNPHPMQVGKYLATLFDDPFVWHVFLTSRRPV